MEIKPYYAWSEQSPSCFLTPVFSLEQYYKPVRIDYKNMASRKRGRGIFLRAQRIWLKFETAKVAKIAKVPQRTQIILNILS
jgi:hypothetical protein